MTSKHLHLFARKRLAGRVAALEALEPRKLLIQAEDGRRALALVEQHALLLIDLESPDDGQLDAHLKAVGESVDQYCVSLPPPVRGPWLSDLSTSLAAEIAQIDCRQCAAKTGHVCNGAPRDAETAQYGHCLRYLRETFEFACEHARRVYGPFSQVPIEVLFETVPSMGVPHRIPYPAAINGYTEYRSASVSAVGLEVCVSQFEWTSYCAVPYVLFHEVIAHAFQGLGDASATRVPAAPDNAFTEGWMDYLALELMITALRARSTKSGYRAHASEKERIGREFQSRRRDHRRKDACAYALPRATGVAAAQRMLHLFEWLIEDDRSDEEVQKWAWERLWALSLQLNSTTGVVAQRERFVQVVHSYCPLPGEHVPPGQAERLSLLVECVRQYLEDRDVFLLLENACEKCGFK